MKSRRRSLLVLALCCLGGIGRLAGAAAVEAGHRDEEARAVLRAALEQATDAPTRIRLWEALAESHQLANELAAAEAAFRAALETAETGGGDRLQVAALLTRLGNVLRLSGRRDAAAEAHERALRLRESAAPDSPAVADSLHHLALVAWERRDQEALAAYNRRALSLLERSPPGLEMADALSDRALLESDQGRFDEAARSLQKSLSIQQRLAPESLAMAGGLARLGGTVRTLGDPETARELLREALRLRERLAPESLGIASIYSDLGTIAQEEGDLEAARDLYRRSLQVWEKAAPAGRGVGGCLSSLGRLARERGDLDEAWSLHQRAREIFSQLAVDGQGVAIALGDLGDVAEARGDLQEALALQQQAWEIMTRRVPGGIEEALALHQIGRLTRRLGRTGEAARHFARAIEVLESAVGRFEGLQDPQAFYRARFEEVYRDAIALELDLGHADTAFQLVERSRARSFLRLLAERDLRFSGELPAPLERSLRENAMQMDRTAGALARWVPGAGEEARTALREKLGRLRRERDELAGEVRKASPRLAALRQPEPFDLAAAREALDPGTLALVYSLGNDRTALFALTPDGGLRMHLLPHGEDRLRRDTERFLQLLRQLGPARPGETADDLARSLFQALIEPVADLVERSERVLLLPDGPLNRLPFGALLRTPGDGEPGRGTYLAAWRPLHTALSLTVYGALRSTRRPPAAAAPAAVAVFGDPHHAQEPAAAGPAHDGIRRVVAESPGLVWAPLPASRREAERIARIHPSSLLYLGDEATEERVKSLPRDVRIVHFATHGRLDDRFPLDSALVLSLPQPRAPHRDNGFLQVWEIFESVRLDADLVVLSACESALGRELRGEGTIGLTRAFQYAGARSVVASLWSVADQTTAELMAVFHHHLASGLPKDEALRAAQIELIRKPVRLTTREGATIEIDASAPFFWAAFQLYGDWR